MDIYVHAWITWLTFLLLTITIMSAKNLPFYWMFWLISIGQGLLVYVVFKVLNDDYSKPLKFNDWS